MPTGDLEDLDLDELDAELTEQLGDEDQDPRERHTLSEIRAALRRTKGKLERAFEDGKAAGRDQEQRDQAWKASGIPPAVRTLMGDVDPCDGDALAAKVQELQRDGLRWGDDTAATAARLEDEQRAATLERMSALAAGGSVANVEDDKAAKIKARIDAHQPVSDEEMAWDDSFANRVKTAIDAGQAVDADELGRFLGMVDEAVMAQPRPPGPGPQHPWSDQQAHDVYSRIHRDPASVSDEDAQGFYAWVEDQGRQLAATRGRVPPVPGSDASIGERHAYIIACQRRPAARPGHRRRVLRAGPGRHRRGHPRAPGPLPARPVRAAPRGPRPGDHARRALEPGRAPAARPEQRRQHRVAAGYRPPESPRR